MLIVIRFKHHNSLLFGGLKIGKMSLRTKCVVVCVESPVCWKYGWLENVRRREQYSVHIRHFRYGEKRCWCLIRGNLDQNQVTRWVQTCISKGWQTSLAILGPLLQLQAPGRGHLMPRSVTCSLARNFSSVDLKNCLIFVPWLPKAMSPSASWITSLSFLSDCDSALEESGSYLRCGHQTVPRLRVASIWWSSVKISALQENVHVELQYVRVNVTVVTVFTWRYFFYPEKFQFR